MRIADNSSDTSLRCLTRPRRFSMYPIRRYPNASNNAITALFIKKLPPNASGVRTIKKFPRHDTKNNKQSLKIKQYKNISYPSTRGGKGRSWAKKWPAKEYFKINYKLSGFFTVQFRPNPFILTWEWWQWTMMKKKALISRMISSTKLNFGQFLKLMLRDKMIAHQVSKHLNWFFQEDFEGLVFLLSHHFGYRWIEAIEVDKNKIKLRVTAGNFSQIQKYMRYHINTTI